VVSYSGLLADGLPAQLRQLAGVRHGPGAEPDPGLCPEMRHQVFTNETVERTALLPVLAKRIARLLNDWHSLDERVRARLIRELSADFEQACLFAGVLTYLEPEFLERSRAGKRDLEGPSTSADPQAAERPLIVHYHLFKNAGTSVDAILKQNFPGQWASQEFSSSDHEAQMPELEHLLRNRPDVVAVSSHTLTLPLPAFEGIRPLPIIFVRHPLDRLRSAYDFEVRQTEETEGSRLAKTTDFAGYLEARLSWSGDRACRNFQSYRLAQWLPPGEGEELERALRAVRELPFVGLVEAFDQSMRRFCEIARQRFPTFGLVEAWANASRAAGSSLEKRLQVIREELGSTLYADLESANAWDLTRYEAIVAAYADHAPR
jgi:hypothetical protein